MKKILPLLIIILVITVGALLFLFSIKQKPNSQTPVSSIDLSQIRAEVKIYIDELYNSDVSSIEHTTDGIEKNAKRLPSNPKTFESGRFMVVFNTQSSDDKKVMIFQTEEKVGHIAPVTPGITDIGGYVEIQKNPEKETSEGIDHTTWSEKNQDELNKLQDLKLNDYELDYLIRTLYKKFEKSLTNSQENTLNQVKDYALAIKFSGKSGINEYHQQLIDELKN